MFRSCILESLSRSTAQEGIDCRAEVSRSLAVVGVALLVLAGLSAACGSGSPGSVPSSAVPTATGTTSASVVPSTNASAPSVQDSRSSTTGWDCVGDPPEIAAGWRTEIAVVQAGAVNPLELAMRGAQDKLRAKLCVNAEKDRAAADTCSFLASKIEPWKTGQSSREVCASAVVQGRYIDEWNRLANDLGAFDKSLGDAAKRFTDSVRLSKAKTLARVALAAVYDDNGTDPKQNQLPGGRRADWLAARFRAAFPVQATIVVPPRAWSIDQGAPPGFDVVVVGRMWRRIGVSVPTVEVSWTGAYTDGHLVESPGGAFPEAAAPSPPATTPPPIPVTPGLYLTMDSDHAGSICAGETTQLWLKSSEELYVRVFDLWGKDGAMLIFPSDPNTSGRVQAKQTLALGNAKGFEAIPAAGSEEERYLVIGAPTLAGLGRFAAAKGYCRLGPSDAAALIRSDSYPPGARIATTGYRLLTGSTCPAPPSAAHLAAAEKALALLPTCAR